MTYYLDPINYIDDAWKVFFDEQDCFEKKQITKIPERVQELEELKKKMTTIEETHAEENWFFNHDSPKVVKPQTETDLKIELFEEFSNDDYYEDFSIHWKDRDFLEIYPKTERMIAYIRRNRDKRRIIITNDILELKPVSCTEKLPPNEKIKREKRIYYKSWKPKNKKQDKSFHKNEYHCMNSNKFETVFSQNNNPHLQKENKEPIRKYLQPKQLTNMNIIFNFRRDGMIESANCGYRNTA